MISKKRSLLILILLFSLASMLIFTACGEDKGPKKMEVLENPYKTEYFVGETVDLTGAKFKVTYGSGETEEVGIDSQYIQYDTSFIENSVAGKKNITIIFNKVSDRQVYVNIQVEFKSIDLVKIDLIQNTLPTVVKQNSQIDFSSVQAVATYSNNTTQDLTSDQLEFSSVDTTTCGDHIVTVTFGGKSAIFSIFVDYLVIEQINFSGGVFNEYAQGDIVSVENIIIQITLDDGSTVDFRGNSSEIEVTGLSTNEKGDFEIVAKYVGDDYKLIDVNIKGTHAYSVIW